MPGIMNLFGNNSNVVRLSSKLCEDIANVLSEGECVPVTYTKDKKGNIEEVRFSSKDNKTEWIIECGQATVEVVKSTLRDSCNDTQSKVLHMLRINAQSEIFSIVLKNMHDNRTIKWCTENNFTQISGSSDYLYKWTPKSTILLEIGDDFGVV